MADVQKVEPKIDPVMEKPWQRAKRMERYDFYNKSQYPPMSIEPQPYERSRLAGQGMTPEQRALRKQWVLDQTLHHEPRVVPEVQPYNIFRRIYRWPADTFLYKPVKNLFGANLAYGVRYVIPKFLMAFGGFTIAWYQLKYHANDWTSGSSLHVMTAKPRWLGKGEPLPEKQENDYYDHGFKSRTALRD